MLFVTGYIPLPRGDWRIADVTKKTLAREDFMSWLASLQTAIGKIPERLQLMREMLRLERGHRIKAEAGPAFTSCTIDIFDIVIDKN